MADAYRTHEERRLRRPLENAISLTSVVVALFILRDFIAVPDVAPYTAALRAGTALFGFGVAVLLRRNFNPLYALSMSFVLVLITLHAMVLAVMPEALVMNQTSLFMIPLAACGFVPFRRDLIRIQGWLIIVTQVALFIQRPDAVKYFAVETQLFLATLVTFFLGSYSVQSRQRRFILETKLREEADRDALTSLFNRRFFSRVSELLFQQSQRHKRSLSALVVDIDHFKVINDTHGHDVGDTVIQATARTLLEQVRTSDVSARMGGEEFAVLLSDTNAADAALVAERIRNRVSELSISLNGHIIKWTVSIGVAELVEDDTRITALLRRADQALYTAKRSGRNLVSGSKLVPLRRHQGTAL
jgi:diguanylate cyclase (GGDEF)-like protein